MSGRRESLLYVNDMVEAATRIASVCDGVPDELLLDDPGRSDTLLWRLTVLGEAAKSTPEVLRAAHPEVAWSEAARLRDRVVHHYDGVDPVEIARVVREDLPRMLASLLPLQASLLADWERRQTEAGEPPDW